VCDSVAQSLVGQKLSSFTGVRAFVLKAFEDSLAGILNKRAVDVLHDVQVRLGGVWDGAAGLRWTPQLAGAPALAECPR
jgi:hypothetical protein